MFIGTMFIEGELGLCPQCTWPIDYRQMRGFRPEGSVITYAIDHDCGWKGFIDLPRVTNELLVKHIRRERLGHAEGPIGEGEMLLAEFRDELEMLNDSGDIERIWPGLWSERELEDGIDPEAGED